MKWYLLMGLTVLSLSGCNNASQDGRRHGRGCDQHTSRTDDSWHGPGYYKGVWIQTEGEYNDWYYNNTPPRSRQSRGTQTQSRQYRQQNQ